MKKLFVVFCNVCQEYISSCSECKGVDVVTAANRAAAWEQLKGRALTHDANAHPDTGWVSVELLEIRPTREMKEVPKKKEKVLVSGKELRRCGRCDGAGRYMGMCTCGAHFGGSCRCESRTCESCGGSGKVPRA
jgi:hypothetical protein